MTGFVAPYLAGRSASRTVTLETRRDREDELRVVMDNAAIQLTEAIALLDQIRSRLSALSPGDLTPLQNTLTQLWLNEDRMAVRLGRDATEVRHYRQSISHIATAHTLLNEGLEYGPGDGVSTKLVKERSAAYAAQGEFFNAASGRVGPGAPSRGQLRWPSSLAGDR